MEGKLIFLLIVINGALYAISALCIFVLGSLNFLSFTNKPLIHT